MPGSASPYPRDFIVDAAGVVQLAKHEYDPGAMISVIENLLKNTTTIEESLVEIPNKWLLVSAYPNPFNPIITLEMKVHDSAELSAYLYDTKGQVVSQIFKKSIFSQGTHSMKVDTEGLPSGLYLIRVAGSGVQVVKKILKIQ